MPKFMKILAVLAFGLMGLVNAKAQETIKVALITDPGYHSALWAAMNGKVSDPNVKLEIEMMPIPALIQAAMTKQYDILPNGIAAIVQMKNAGLDVKVLGTEIRYIPAGNAADLWVKADSEIKTGADLKGKRVAVTSIEASNVISLRMVLEDQFGVNPAPIGGDINWVEIPSSQFKAAIDSGEVDAVAFSNVLAYKMAQTGDYRSVVNGSAELDKMFGGPLPTVVEIAYTDKIEANPDLYEAAAKLIQASAAYAVENPDEVYSAVAPEYEVTVDELQGYFSSYSVMPMALNDTDASVIQQYWKRAEKLGSLTDAPESVEPYIWDRAVYEK